MHKHVYELYSESYFNDKSVTLQLSQADDNKD